MKTLHLVLAVAATCFCLAMPPLVTGPFHLSIPVDGISEDSLPILAKIFDERFGRESFIYPQVEDGMLHFLYFGGSIKALLGLEEVAMALKEAQLEVDRTIWRLKKQMMGVCLSSKEGIKTTDVIAALNSIEGISVEESLLFGDRTCHVIHLGRAINYVDFIASIEKSKLEVDDLIWSHWKHGWEIDEGEHGDHEMGMVFIEVIED